jgi:hypothetical protein
LYASLAFLSGRSAVNPPENRVDTFRSDQRFQAT